MFHQGRLSRAYVAHFVFRRLVIELTKSAYFITFVLARTESSTLLDSLKDKFGEPELLDVAEGNGWRPEKGAEKVNAHKGSSLLANGLPPILQFHLLRFNYDWNTDTTTKLNNEFTFPKSMDLAPICIDVEESDPRSEYELQAVIVHMGEFNVGHYYAYVRPDIESNKWYRFNDDKVDRVEFEDVIADAFGGKQKNNNIRERDSGLGRRIRRLFRNNNKDTFGWGGRTSNAYVVQYVRRNSIQSLYSTP
jgi:ubiquitin carboxyl-terminal hydrolase 7